MKTSSIGAVTARKITHILGNVRRPRSISYYSTRTVLMAACCFGHWWRCCHTSGNDGKKCDLVTYL